MAKNRQHTARQTLSRAVFVGYILLMLWLLFGQRMGAQGEATALYERMNLEPFGTIGRYFPLLSGENGLTLRRLAVINLVGNVIMFVPLGYCLPRIFPWFRHFFRTFFLCFLLIVLVELVQLFTGLGVCDVDDLILNMVGVCIGYPFGKLKKH